MAFTLRTDEHHENILDRLCYKLGIKAKNKAVLMVLENYEKVVKERDDLYKKSIKLERELLTLKQAVRSKFEIDKKISELIQNDLNQTN